MASAGRKTPKADLGKRGPRPSAAASAPEVKISYSSAGRETLQAIEEELLAVSPSTAEAPQIEISEAPAGRETLAAIAEELAESSRPRQNTLPYADRISNAPGANGPQRGSLRPAHVANPNPATEAAAEALEIFELLTFIVRGNKTGDLSTEALRRRFVERNLLHRVPGQQLDAVERIEVTPWTTKGTMVVRIWCRA